ncbi:MAG: UDP-N-acetylmuramoyl-L-alanine--D-glutamate ligase [Bacteroidetes bacterium]|nr:UDP-N-acetylmuramoyl-L-alanine--D-glutamate ligase [Bacteroidota bacterium]
MKTLLNNLISGKKVLILGFGREGQSTYHLLRKYFPEFFLTIADLDENIIAKNSFLEKDNYFETILGADYLKCISKFDIVIKSPGISLNNIDIEFNPEKIASQTDLFLRKYHKQVIGITGTKGKSTTSSLIFEILNSFSKNTLLVGNIGIPPFDVIDKIDESTKIVCELSSHQLEFITVAPHISILLNLFQEHLDHYKSYLDYQKAKINILKYQSKDDFFIFHQDDELIQEFLRTNNFHSHIFSFSNSAKSEAGCFIKDNKIFFRNGNHLYEVFDKSQKIFLQGDHNFLNVMASINATILSGIPVDFIVNSIKEFKGLPHRIEFVGSFNEVDYYNDSISTIPEATIQAVKTLKNVSTLILGGHDRGIDYSVLVDFIRGSKIENIIFIAEAGKRIFELLKSNNIQSSRFFVVETMEEAVGISQKETSKNMICLLSPAAASYGMFKNFEERGDVFKKLIKN